MGVNITVWIITRIVVHFDEFRKFNIVYIKFHTDILCEILEYNKSF